MEEEVRSAVQDGTEATPEIVPEVIKDVEIPGGQWEQEKAELEDLLRRRQAEFENFRRRVDRERIEFAEYASMESVRALLPILDDFERGLKAAQVSGASDSELTKGIELIYKRLMETLTRQGLEPIDTGGRAFDPHMHNAVQRVEREDVDEGTILEEYQRGYQFKGKLLRPSMVTVAVRP